MTEPTPQLAGRRVLVVEDEYLIAMELKRWLERAGAEVAGPVPNFGAALDAIAGGRLDAAVLDVSLTDRAEAYPIADRLGALGVPYAFATGNVRVSDADAYRGRPRIAKPFRERDIVRAVLDLMALPA